MEKLMPWLRKAPCDEILVFRHHFANVLLEHRANHPHDRSLDKLDPVIPLAINHAVECVKKATRAAGKHNMEDLMKLKSQNLKDILWGLVGKPGKIGSRHTNPKYGTTMEQIAINIVRLESGLPFITPIKQ